MIKCSSLGSKFIQFNKVVLNKANYSESRHDVIWGIYTLWSLSLWLWVFNVKFNICICFSLPFYKDLTRKNNLSYNCQDTACRIFIPSANQLANFRMPHFRSVWFASLKLPLWFTLDLPLFYSIEKKNPHKQTKQKNTWCHSCITLCASSTLRYL